MPLPRKDKKMARTIRNEPNWENLFAAAIRISETNIDKNEGQQLVVEMLKYGQRLYLQDKKNKEVKKIPITKLIETL